MAVADRFAHRDDVGHHALRLERPHVRTNSAEAELHFVGDAHAPGGAHVSVGGAEVAVRKGEHAAGAEDAFAEERGGMPPSARHRVELFRHPARVSLTVAGPVAAQPPAIGVGHLCDPDVVALARAAGSGELVRADVDDGCDVAVVDVVDRDNVVVARVGPGQAQGEIVGLGTRVHHEHDAEIRWSTTVRTGRRHRGAEPTRVLDEVVVEVARVRVQQRHLPLTRRNDAGVAVAHVADVVHHVEVAVAVVVDEVDAFAADDLQWFGIGEAQRATEHVSPLALQPWRVALHDDAAVHREAEHEVRVREHGAPHIPLAPGHNSDDLLRAPAAQIGHHLEVEVRRPVAVLVRSPQAGDDLSGLHLLARHEPLETRG